jgi:hypothetical protein
MVGNYLGQGKVAVFVTTVPVALPWVDSLTIMTGSIN